MQNDPQLRYRISPRRLVVMTSLSAGQYLWYWFYLTWKQYRDHTGERAYPFWHVGAVGVPIYGIFPVHAHVTALNAMISRGGVPVRIAPGWVVLAFAIFYDLNLALLPFGLQEITKAFAAILLLVSALTVAVSLALLLSVQRELNTYWDSLADTSVQRAGLGVGETILAVVGALMWLSLVWVLLGLSETTG